MIAEYKAGQRWAGLKHIYSSYFAHKAGDFGFVFGTLISGLGERVFSFGFGRIVSAIDMHFPDPTTFILAVGDSGGELLKIKTARELGLRLGDGAVAA